MKKTKKKSVKKSKVSRKASSRSQTKKPKAAVSRSEQLKRSTKKMVDEVLLKLNPQVQKQFELLKANIEATPTSMADMKILGFKILERAKVLSETLKASKASSVSKPQKASLKK